ncbi:hypothetical protein PSACC_03602 [Paramicrosporidium saccamoebae]|uniref:Uncharacterized protein n=1 Tax=Paramicrosporidium saccamoebae TaxID=1246581 RepID=A0A2H9TFU4_9FUNG|nr:hypothetical protein PSACC_03602 [Paramicrosporidium saccamoebae]
MSPSPNVPLAEIWTGLFVAISNIRHHVLREREIDATSNVQLKDFPRITEDVVEIAKILRSDVNSNGLEGPSVEYFMNNDIGGTLMSLAREDIPKGVFSLMIGFNTALLSTLPPAFFINDRTCAPLRSLIISLHSIVMCGKSELFERIILLLEHVIAQVCQYPNLRLVIIPDQTTRDALYSMISMLIDFDVTMPGLQELTEKGFESGLISGPESEDIVVSVVFSLVKIFSSGTNLQFKTHFEFVQRCLGAAKNDSAVPSLLITAYRDSFVDRIFTAALQGSSPNDGSLEVLLSILTDLIESKQSLELYIPLLSKSVRLLEQKRGEESERILVLYGYAFSSRTLFKCFPMRSPKQWTESITIHRKRLGSLLSLVSNLGLAAYRSHKTISDFYRIHLLTIEKLLGEDLIIEESVPDMLPQIREQNLCLNTEKITKVSTLFAKMKSQIVDFWNRNPRVNLFLLRFAIGCFAFFDAGIFYAELSENDPNSFISSLVRLIADCPEVIPDEGMLEAMFAIHVQHDPFDPLKWDSSLFVKDLVVYRTGNTYLLGHLVMRLASIVQVRATRESTCIVYD